MSIREVDARKIDKVVVVGGVAGGMSAATRLRRNDESLEVVVLERGPHVSFANCGLPYHLGGVIEDREALLLQTPESLAARFALDVRVRHEVLEIDTEARTLRVHDLEQERCYQESYDVLVLAPGAAPVIPAIDGIEYALTLRDVGDLDAAVVAAERASTAVILGAGFIGLEVAENLRARGLEVTIVEKADQVLTPLDPEMAAPVADELARHRVSVRTGAAAVRIEPGKVHLEDGEVLPADLVLAAVGVRPESSLAVRAGLRTGASGGIAVDASQRTSDPHVYAVGDATEKHDAIAAAPVLVPLAQTANRHGRLVADVITGRPTRSAPVLGTAVVGVFGLTVAVVGWNERRLRAAGRPVRIVHTHPLSHAGYYPGAEAMALKLVVDPVTDRILGAQGVGRAGVDKRIDVIATAIRGGLTASDLADLELAYAPQFGSAKDPVNMLGFVADNLATGRIRAIQWHELADALAAGAALIDVRKPDELAMGSIPGSINLPLDQLRGGLDELPDGPLVVHCAVGLRGSVAARLLAQHGRDVVNLDGGYRTWAAGTGAADA